MLLSIILAFGLIVVASATTSRDLIWDGRVGMNETESDLNSSIGPYLTVVKGSEPASHYTTLLGTRSLPTPLWRKTISEQVISVTIDNSSIFIPGGGTAQNGFRRTDLIAQVNGSNSALDTLEVGLTQYSLFDGTHVFELQLGTPFSNPTASSPAADATNLKVRDHALNLLFETPFTANHWHNFAVQVDWNKLTLEVFYSTDDARLEAVTSVVSNPTASTGSAGQGDFHIALLKLPLVDPSDSPEEQGNVVDFGIQEGDTEGLLFSDPPQWL
ncbi:hypothetical protein BT96DRAFT_937242 [Gymnopus androsaceus JB14]|uniref:Glycoside hydrolase 131 catalytic N-terminal domain-containing protein n=1 Tax=Gymnopus androsaceus JB14 TaxID=1447944 RepID=A0A6A4HSW2_9AGAR|nr:hypothetical protein BT96DRAFT_937242 [Gymnopus androsaceus JB14]